MTRFSVVLAKYGVRLRVVVVRWIIEFMSTDLSQVVQSALSLPQSDRAKLASALLRSLDSQVDDDPQVIAKEWEKVILARSDALHRGEVELVDSEAVISELRNLISDSKSATGQ